MERISKEKDTHLCYGPEEEGNFGMIECVNEGKYCLNT